MRTLRALCAIVFLSATALQAQILAQRPQVFSISRVSYYVSDLDAARRFWHGLLGFDERRIGLFEINAYQMVQLFTGPSSVSPSHMQSLRFTVSNVRQMASYLEAYGYEVQTLPLPAEAIAVKDPEGLRIEFVQPALGAIPIIRNSNRISTQIFHTGFTVHHLAKTMDFYQRILGFTEIWRGSSDGKTLSWINMKVPDGTDYVEFMLGPTNDAKSLGGKNHLSLSVPNIDKAATEIKTRAATINYTRAIDIHTGVNRKHQLNLFDPDGTRVELMEPFTVDGKPTPPSTAPPPPDQPWS